MKLLGSFTRTLATALYYIFDGIVILLLQPPCKPNKIAFVRGDAIGDFIIWIDSIRGLSEIYPSDKFDITIIVNRSYAALLGDLTYFRRVIAVDRNSLLKNPIYRYKILKEIRQEGFGTIVHPTYSRDFWFGDAVVRASGAKTKIGFDGACSNITRAQKLVSDRWYSQLIPASAEPMTELNRNAEFIRGLGLKSFKSRIPQITTRDDTLLTSTPKEYFVIFPHASWHGKRWDIDKFVEVSSRLQSATGWGCVVCGGKDPLIEATLSSCHDRLKPFINLTGVTSLPQLVSIIRGAKIVISNDTSAVHISAAVSTPSVCIMGGGHYGRFLPYMPEEESKGIPPTTVSVEMSCYNCNWDCIYRVGNHQAVPCVSNVAVEHVWAEVEGIVEQIQNSY